MKRIAMIAAMQKEILPLTGGEDVLFEEKYGYSVARFKMGENEIFLVQSGIGEISAAAATQMAICEYSPDLIINFGVCGALLPNLELKKVVLVRGVVHYDFDLSPLGEKKSTYPEFPTIIGTDEGLANAVKRLDGGIKEVICASSDRFVVDKGLKRELFSEFGAEICDMESAGIIVTAKKAGLPCLMIKAVSDGEEGAADYENNVQAATKEYVEIIKKVLNDV